MRVCREVQEWVEEEVERPIEEWEDRQVRRCRNEPCNWWMLCLNRVVCWFVVVAVKVLRWIIVTVGKWITRIVCEVIGLLLNIIGWVLGIILSIPIIGGIIRTVLNWATEIIWRSVGALDFAASLLGIRPRKKMYFGLILPDNQNDGFTAITEAQMTGQVAETIAFYDRVCNINMIYTGACSPEINAPNAIENAGCDAAGFFSDWWLGGSFLELVTNICKFQDSFRRIIGHGAEISVIGINQISGRTIGCSFGPTHNFVFVEGTSDDLTTAHEIGHACGLILPDSGHVGDANNLMFATTTPAAAPTLSAWQISVVRSSRHCVYL